VRARSTVALTLWTVRLRGASTGCTASAALPLIAFQQCYLPRIYLPLPHLPSSIPSLPSTSDTASCSRDPQPPHSAVGTPCGVVFPPRRNC